MLRSWIRLFVLTFLGGSLMPVVLAFQDPLRLKVVILFCAAVIATVAFYYLLQRLAPLIDSSAVEQAQFLDKLDPQYVDLAILFSAALSLFLELAVIRWQSTVFEFFAFYKNFGSCTLLVMSDESTVRMSSTPGLTSALLMRAIVYDCTMAYVASPSHQARGPTTAVVA